MADDFVPTRQKGTADQRRTTLSRLGLDITRSHVDTHDLRRLLDFALSYCALCPHYASSIIVPYMLLLMRHLTTRLRRSRLFDLTAPKAYSLTLTTEDNKVSVFYFFVRILTVILVLYGTITCGIYRLYVRQRRTICRTHCHRCLYTTTIL